MTEQIVFRVSELSRFNVDSPENGLGLVKTVYRFVNFDWQLSNDDKTT